VKCIYCCKFITSWYHFVDNNNKSWSNTSKWSIIKNTTDITRIEPRTSWRLLLYLERNDTLYHLTIVALYIYQN
jgi:hypothetical protein